MEEKKETRRRKRKKRNGKRIEKRKEGWGKGKEEIRGGQKKEGSAKEGKKRVIGKQLGSGRD